VKAAAGAGGVVISVDQTIDSDQTYRYAEVSGDHNSIHLDADFARSVGLPGIIVHGMCVMAFAGRAVVAAACVGDPARLKRLAVRFARPVFPGQEITTRIWAADQGVDRPTGEHSARRTYAFETVNPDGKAVLLDGLAEVAGSTDR
jgi:acyl dehydratase